MNLYLFTFKIFFSIIFIVIIFKISIYFRFKEDYLPIENNLNLSFLTKMKTKINLGILAYRIKDGGRARITTLLINYLYNIKIFNIYLFTLLNKEDNEYLIPEDVYRTIIKNNMIKEIKKKKIHILIYQLESSEHINLLNNLKNIKIIYYLHTSCFDMIYGNYSAFKSLYKAYINSKYVISIVPFDHYYLFKKWGISSILLDNFITYDYNSIIPSNLSSKNILMMGRGNAKKKRFQIGIQSMEYIIKEISKCVLKILSDFTRINILQNLVYDLNLEKNIQFLGYISSPNILFENINLNIFPSISEAFPMVLSETKIYGIPSILLGLDYITIAKGGTIIIYDDSPESLSKEIIKILKNFNINKKLGEDARINMKKYNNKALISKWVKLILSVYKGDKYYQQLREENKKINKEKLINIINNQIQLLKKRELRFNNIHINEIENFSYLENLN